MTTDAICVILDKAWELNTRAFIFIKGMSRFEVYPEKWDWKTYDDLDVLCIFNKKSKIEYYIDVKEIFEIIINVTGGDQKEEE